MSLRAVSRLAPRARASVVRLSNSQNRLMGGGPALPPFKRNLAPTSTLHEEHELVWDDGVAPELTIDFDAQHIGSKKGLAMFAGGLLFFLSLFGFVAVTDPASKNPALNRTINMIPDPPSAAAEDEDEDEE